MKGNSELLVSILIPAYNAEVWIGETLQSALAQTWPRKEIIVVDDGSADRTLEVAEKFSSRNVKIVAQPNQGAAAARNKALSICQGDYIQWLDADDLLAPEKISKQIAVARVVGKSTLLSSGWASFMYRTQGAKFIPSALWTDLSPADWLIHKLGKNLHMQTATWLTSRELTANAGPWNPQMFGDDDGEYFSRVLLASDGVKFVSGTGVYYRVTGSNRLSNIGSSHRKMEAQLASMRMHISRLRSLEESARVRNACISYLRNWVPSFYPERPDLFHQAQEIARSLGAELEAPQLRGKYAWIRPLFGWAAAKRAQTFFPGLKSSLACAFDKAIYKAETFFQGHPSS